MNLPFFDRLDFVVTKVLLALVSVAVPVLTIAVPLVAWLRDEPLRWELVGLGRPGVPRGLEPADGTTVRSADTVIVRIHDAGATAWLASLLPGVLLSLVVGVAVWLIFRLVQRIEEGRPFVVASASALRLLGATILIGSLAISFGAGAADALIAQRALDSAPLSFGFQLPAVPLLSGLVVLALAEAFTQGARLQDDVEGLV